MEIETLRLFREVVSRASITDAARRCFMSQQALSRKLAALEEELGHQLINRTTPLTLTPAGKVFLRDSNDVISAYERMTRDLDEIGSRQPARIWLRDYGTGSFTSIFAGVLDELNVHHPEIDVRFVRVNEDDVYLIENGIIDLGFVRTITVDGTEYLKRNPSLEYLKLVSETSRLVFGARSGHPLHKIARPSLRDVTKWRLAMPTDTDNGAFPLSVKRLFDDLGIELKTESVYCDSSTEHFFEYFTGMSPESVAFFTERSYGEYMSGVWLGEKHHQKICLCDADYEAAAYAVYSKSATSEALRTVVDAIQKADEAMAVGAGT